MSVLAPNTRKPYIEWSDLQTQRSLKVINGSDHGLL